MPLCGERLRFQKEKVLLIRQMSHIYVTPALCVVRFIPVLQKMSDDSEEEVYGFHAKT